MSKVIRKNQIFILLIGMFITIPEVFLGNDRIETVKELMESGQLHLVRQQIVKLAEGQELPEEDVLELCDLLEAQDQIPLAISFLEKQCRYHSHSTKIYERLANYYLQNNQVLKAVGVYEKLVQENPQKRDYWVQLGQLYTWNEQQMQAIKAYEKAISHVGIEYLTGKWWWDICENVCYFGDPCLKVWSPAYSWEKPLCIDAGIIGEHIM